MILSDWILLHDYYKSLLDLNNKFLEYLQNTISSYKGYSEDIYEIYQNMYDEESEKITELEFELKSIDWIIKSYKTN